MRVEIVAKNSKLVVAPDGAIATVRIGNTDEIVGLVMNHTSADGLPVSTFATFVDGFEMPVIVMTEDTPEIVYEVINASLAEFCSIRARKDHLEFFSAICDHHGWVFDVAAALHGAYQLGKKFENRITADEAPEANEIVKASREQFYGYANIVLNRSN